MVEELLEPCGDVLGDGDSDGVTDFLADALTDTDDFGREASAEELGLPEAVAQTEALDDKLLEAVKLFDKL